MTDEELAEIDRKVSEIEQGPRNDDIDEDDAGYYTYIESYNHVLSVILTINEYILSGVKRPSEHSTMNNVDDGNTNTKTNQPSRSHASDRRTEFNFDGEYSTSK